MSTFSPFGGSVVFKNQPKCPVAAPAVDISDKLASAQSDEWNSRLGEAKSLLVTQLGLDESSLATEAQFITALKDGSLLCRLAQSLSQSCGLDLQIRLSQVTPNGEARVVHQNLSRFSRFCRAINLPAGSMPSIQDLSSGRLKPIVTCLCDIKRLKDEENFVVYAATWEAFSTPTKQKGRRKGQTSALKMAIENSIKSEKSKQGGLMRVLRPSFAPGEMNPLQPRNGVFGSPVGLFGNLQARMCPLEEDLATHDEKEEMLSPGSMYPSPQRPGSETVEGLAGTPERSIHVDLLQSLSKVEAKAKLNQNNKHLEDKLARAMATITSLNLKLEEQETVIASMKSDWRATKDGLQNTSNQLQQATKTVVASVDVLESKEYEINMWKSKFQKLEFSISAAANEKVQENNLAIMKVKELEVTLANSEKNVDSLVVELSETKAKEAALSQQLSAMASKLRDVEGAAATHQATLQALQTANADMKTRLATTVQLSKAGMSQASTKFRGTKLAFERLKDTVAFEMNAMKDEFGRVMSDIVFKCKQADEDKRELVENYEREIDSRRKVFNELQRLRGNIRVLCRVRPLGKGRDEEDGTVKYEGHEHMFISPNDASIIKKFSYDTVFQASASQKDVYDEVSPMVQSSMDGFRSCIFAYGQTGSGKTHTMQGPTDDPGVYTRSLRELFLIKEQRKQTHHYTITVSMVEIYNEQIRDLLTPDTSNGLTMLDVKRTSKSGNSLPNSTVMTVNSIEDIHHAMARGAKNRSVGATKANEHSSRSHCLLMITADGEEIESGECMHGRLVLVDLAGSERVGKTDASGSRLKEAQNINKSLSALGNVINALSNKQGHVPFRDSKLTYLLQDSLSKDNKVLMIAQVSADPSNFQESVCSLEFAGRARGVELGVSKAKVQNMEVPKLQAQLKRYKDDIRAQENKVKEFVSMKKTIKVLEAENDTMQHKLAAFETSQATRNSTMKETEKAMSETHATCKVLERKLSDSENRVGQWKEKCSTYESRLATLEQTVSTLGKELSSAEKRNSELEHQLATQPTLGGSSSVKKRATPSSSRRPSSARKSATKRKSESPDPLRTSNKTSGILKTCTGDGQNEAKRIKRHVNFNNELSVKELSFHEDEEDEENVPVETQSAQKKPLSLVHFNTPLDPTPMKASQKSATPSRSATKSARCTTPSSTSSSRKPMTTRQKELEEWRRNKAKQSVAPARSAMSGGAKRVTHAASSRSRPARSRPTALTASSRSVSKKAGWQ